MLQRGDERMWHGELPLRERRSMRRRKKMLRRKLRQGRLLRERRLQPCDSGLQGKPMRCRLPIRSRLRGESVLRRGHEPMLDEQLRMRQRCSMRGGLEVLRLRVRAGHVLQQRGL